MELGGVGAVVLIDTAGIDDEGALGKQRVSRTKTIIKEVDLAILLFTHNTFGLYEEQLLVEFEKCSLPAILVHNKSDIVSLDPKIAEGLFQRLALEVIACSAKSGEGISFLLDLMQNSIKDLPMQKSSLLGNLITKERMVVLVCPIDNGAPKGRLILPQVQTIRDILDNHAIAICLTKESFPNYMQKGLPADLVITDSQLFGRVERYVPAHVPLTSFSVLLAHHKGLFSHFLPGTPMLSRLMDGDKVLILESCTHHASCEDIGRIKLPNRIKSFTGKDIHFQIVAGLDPLPEPLTSFALVIQCGGCMVTQKQLTARIQAVCELGVPLSNYGMALAYMSGIFERAVSPFRDEF